MRKKITPEKEAEVVVLLESGYTLADVSRKLDMPYETVRKLKKRTGVIVGRGKEAMIEECREKLLQALSSDFVQEQSAQLVLEELRTAQKLRKRLDRLLDSMPESPASLRDAASMARAYTAIATALKASNDVLRASFKLGAEPTFESELPELVVREMTHEEVLEIRASRSGTSA